MAPRPKFLPKVLFFAFVVLVASSCGLKGPLYRTDEPPRSDSVAPAQNPEAGKKKPVESSVQPPATDPDRPAVPPER
jgi:predicted small lipoprotein YifL